MMSGAVRFFIAYSCSTALSKSTLHSGMPLNFGRSAPKFNLIFGAAGEPIPAPEPDSIDMIGMAWLYALHVRSSIARGRHLQAEHMLSGMRDSALALACKRHGVAAVQGRGLDDLPEELQVQAADCLAQSLEPVALKGVSSDNEYFVR